MIASSVHYVIKLGPFETGDGSLNAYLGIQDDGLPFAQVVGLDDALALREIAASAPPGCELRCEATMAPAAIAIGLEPAPIPPWAVEPRACFALWMALDPSIAPRDPSALHLLGAGAARFLRAEPWRTWSHTDPITVSIDGPTKMQLECSIVGAAGVQTGIGLYRRAGAVQRIADNIVAGNMEPAAGEDSLVVVFEDVPPFVSAALREGFGLERLPCPMKQEGGMWGEMNGEEMAIVAGTLRLLAEVTPGEKRASMALGDGARALRLSITMP